ncbi:MerR family transcriptional regulator [Bacillus methanolicus]|uniref:Chromosome-anchoring protein RacA n=1 Tax=Bacillus methanolicus (strain MGA3 / ATCC 53907) TaxID=796606 RepID=I3E3M7_BACMM|nr:MerR family transcriptional regulator [Bacillus methanolicus]AIE58829.1 polar chromosome segregation protein [Bacillus methanolicus MGA3]EIJ81098.1 polar chromosome segregation protein [Bacillus methanolicus MGA3]UQD50923.1 MerR family transcriptional regulator [Bacillus methanolicus]
MNTSAVAKLLGVSQSTVQRWVKQLDLKMERNDLGHYVFTDEDIELLKQVHEQLKNGVPLQDLAVTQKKIRKGTAKTSNNVSVNEELVNKINDLERRLNDKADSVVSYQLLQHRREIEELQNEIKKLHERIELLEQKQSEKKKSENLLVFDQTGQKKKQRKKFITMLFGF